MADFKTRTPAIDPTAFANVLQRKVQVEQEQMNYEQEADQKRLKGLMDAVVTGQNIASNMMTMAEKRNKLRIAKEEEEAQNRIAELANKPLEMPWAPGMDLANPGDKAKAEEFRQRELRAALAKSASKEDYNKSLLTQMNPEKAKGNQFDSSSLSVVFKGEKTPRIIKGSYDTVNRRLYDWTGKDITDQAESVSPAYAPAIVEDSEGRKNLAGRSGEGNKRLFADMPVPETGKEKRIQFTPEERRALVAARTEFDTHEFVKQSKQVLPDISSLQELIAQNPKGAIGPVRTKVSKQVAGEVGRLTDEDIARNVPTPDLIPNVQQWLRKVKDGDFTDITRERYGILLEIVQKKRADEVAAILDEITTDTTGFDLSNPNYDAVRRTIGRGMVGITDRYAKPEKQAVSSLEAAKKLTPEQRRARIAELEAMRNK